MGTSGFKDPRGEIEACVLDMFYTSGVGHGGIGRCFRTGGLRARPPLPEGPLVGCLEIGCGVSGCGDRTSVDGAGSAPSEEGVFESGSVICSNGGYVSSAIGALAAGRSERPATNVVLCPRRTIKGDRCHGFAPHRYFLLVKFSRGSCRVLSRGGLPIGGARGLCDGRQCRGLTNGDVIISILVTVFERISCVSGGVLDIRGGCCGEGGGWL